MYKALIELSEDRADFVSRLFSRPRPAGLDGSSSAAALFEAYASVAASNELFERNQRSVALSASTASTITSKPGPRC